MRIDFGMVLGIALEFIFFLYYADTLFYCKQDKWKCYLIIAANYLVHLLICTLGSGTVNTIVFIIINFISFSYCYHISIKSAIYQSFLLAILSISSELLIIFIPFLDILPHHTVNMNPTQSLILTLTSKSIYLVGILILTKIFFNNPKNNSVSSLAIISIPVISTVILILIYKNYVASNLFSMSCFLLILVNCILLYINKQMINTDLELTELKSEQDKHSINLEEYTLLKERNERAKIFRHDFKEYINTLPTLIINDQDKAIKFINEIYKEATTTDLYNYSDNTMLNIVITKKIEECAKKDISLKVEPVIAKMSFLTDTDTVALFSNLINNAIESCENSEKKEIFLNITRCNESYIHISVENSADKKPVVIKGYLKTHKANKDLHGIGMNSIKRTTDNYDGILSWNYDQDKKIFCTNILLKNHTKTTTEVV